MGIQSQFIASLIIIKDALKIAEETENARSKKDPRKLGLSGL